MTASKGSTGTNVPLSVEGGVQRHGKGAQNGHAPAKNKKPGPLKMPLAVPSVQVPKKSREPFGNANVPTVRHSPSRHHTHRQEPSAASDSSLIQMLLAASQRSTNNQQHKAPVSLAASQRSTNNQQHKTPVSSPSASRKPTPNQPRPRKNSLPLASGSGAYAGAAFDRAPTAESFPVPNFLKQNKAEAAALPLEKAFSTSCPMRSIHLQELFTEAADSRPASPLSQLKKVEPASPSPPTKSTSLPGSTGKRRTDLQSLTNDLRKILKLPTPNP